MQLGVSDTDCANPVVVRLRAFRGDPVSMEGPRAGGPFRPPRDAPGLSLLEKAQIYHEGESMRRTFNRVAEVARKTHQAKGRAGEHA